MLGDMLMLDANGKAALAEYSAVLATHPDRFNSLYGAGSAAYASGDSGKGRDYFTQLLKISSGAERPELASARKRLANPAGE